MSSTESRDGPWALMSVACRPFASGIRLDISLSDIPTDVVSIFYSSLFLTAKVTPWFLLAFSRYPLQIKVYPFPTTAKLSSHDNRISEKAVMSMLYFCSSWATMSVLRRIRASCNEECAESIMILTFPVARVKWIFVLMRFVIDVYSLTLQSTTESNNRRSYAR